MFNITQVQTALRGLVGYTQMGGEITLDSDNLKSDSGLRYEGASGIINQRNIAACINDQMILTDADDYNSFLQEFGDSSVAKLLHAVTGRMQAGGRSDLIDAKPLYQRTPLFDRKSDLKRWNGYRITVPRGVVCEIELIDVEAKSTATIDVLLYDLTRRKLVDTKTLNSEEDEVKSNAVGWTLYPGMYFVATESDIEQQNRAQSMERFNGIRVKSVSTSKEWRFNNDDFNASSDSWGLNLHLTTYLDFTEKMEQMRIIFARAVQLQVAVDWLDIFQTSHRSNMDERLTKQAAIELDGIKSYEMIPGKTGLIEQLKLEIDSLSEKLINPHLIETVSCT